MKHVILGPLNLRRLEAFGFALMVVVIVLLSVSILGVSYQLQEEVVIPPGDYYIYEIQGYEWSMVYFSITSDNPVTICITDDTGLSMLESGRGALCFFKVDNTYSLERTWRFPKNGSMYLVMMSDSAEGPTKVQLLVRLGIIPW